MVTALREGREWSNLTADDVAAMVATSSKQRHEIEGDRIRALYGHSVPGRIVRTRAEPPRGCTTGPAPRPLP